MNGLDVVLLVAAAAFGYSGFRQGFIVGLLSLVGFLGGSVLALVLAPVVLDAAEPDRTQSLIAIGVVLVSAGLGQLLFASIGHLLRRRITWAPARTGDSVIGAAMSVLSLLLISWFFASALRPGPIPEISRQISDSSVVTAVDQVMPDKARTLFSSFRRVLDVNALPPVFGGLEPENIRPVAPPAQSVVQSAVMRRAVSSVVEIRSTSTECGRRVVGSGFAYAPQYVMTNAHVVAGVRQPLVRIGGAGRKYAGRVVAYDPARDLAVLYVPDLPSAPLRFRAGAKRGDDAVVAGFPDGGPFQLGAARIRDTITARGPDIYHSRQVDREVFSLYADVEPGNSGGPLLSLKGEVYGVVFAKSLDDADTGYALTAKEAAPVVAKARAATKRVSTGSCA